MKRAARFKLETNPNQRKITQFFTTRIPAGAPPRLQHPEPPPPPPPSRRRTLQNVTAAARNISTNAGNSNSIDSDDDDILEVVEVPKPPPSPKELIVISDSDLESEEGGVGAVVATCSSAQTNQVGGDIQIQTHHRRSESPLSIESDGEISSRVNFVVDQVCNSSRDQGNELPNQNEVDSEELFQDEIIAPSVAGPSNRKDDTFSSGSSCGDEILSQIDIDEVVRLSQSSVSDGEEPHQIVSPSRKENSPPERTAPPRATPKKSPKSPLNKFSPLRHMRKRTSSEASLGSPGNLKSSMSSSLVTRSPKKSLQFGSQDENSTHHEPPRVRYYLKNFINILDEVVLDQFHAYLISSEDQQVVQSFRRLSFDAQSLYVRLFQRKWNWKPVAKIKYKELPPDLNGVCDELAKSGFLERMSANIIELTLEEVLDTLDLPKMLSLSKKMMITGAGGKKTKEACKEALLGKVKNQKTLTGQGSSALLKAALNELGSAYRVTASSKSLFSRLFILYSPPKYWEVETDQASNQLLVILLNNMGQMEYPSYNTNRATLIYRNREELIRFHSSWTLHTNLVAFSESKDWEEVVKISAEAVALLQSLLQDKETVSHDEGLPTFLRIYTAGSVLCHTCWLGVEGFQKLKQFSKANELIQLLLSQTTYLSNYRGRYYERLAINGTHLKYSKQEQKLLLENGLKDPYLRDNHKLILSARLDKLKASILLEATKKPKRKTKALAKRKGRGRARSRTTRGEDYEDDDDDFVCTDDVETQLIDPDDVEVEMVEEVVELFSLKHEVPTRTITGEKMDRGPGNMGKAVFISHQDSSGSNRISSVEQHAIDFYIKEEGYTAGIHGEGSTVATLYGILFWDIIFHDQLPDSFHTRYQPFPLDFHFDDFYVRRRELIEEKLQLIRHVLTMEELLGVVDQIWEEQKSKLSIVSWTLFEDPSPLKGLMKAMGKEAIAHVCERLAKNFRYAASGFPDLTVWNEKEGKVLFVEVKGPGDSLSPKQQLWLDFLIEKEIPCQVCHVKAVSNKRIRV